MKRRTFLKSTGLAVALGSGIKGAKAFVPAHNWDKYDFGSGPIVKDRLNQGPFPIYSPEEVVPESSVVMTTFPSKEVMPNFGMGLVTYVCDEAGPPRVKGETLADSIEKLAALPLGNKLYIRLDWRDLQTKPGRLDLCDHWKITFEMAEKYNKKVGFRIQLMNPVIKPHAVPDFVAEKIPFIKLGKTNKIGLPGKVHYAPRYDHPAFLSALNEFDSLLADMYNGHPDVEFVDTYMYGFWGEGHTWPFEGNPFPDYQTAEKAFVEIFEMQAKNWDKTVLVTNTQPDFSRVGNSEIVDHTIRSNNWLRTDTIFIENMQIESLSNRPPWTGAVIEVGMSDGTPESLHIRNGIPRTENIIAHVKDVSPNYWSLWNWHNIKAQGIMRYYNQYPDSIDDLARSIGYRVRPSWIWHFKKESHDGLVLGLVNDGLAGVPGVLRVYVYSDDRKVNVGGSLDPGYPLPGKVRQAQFILPKGTNWKGLKVRAEIEVKGVRYPVQWACLEKTNDDGSLTLTQNL
ncbi:hypothetical protein J7K93_02630 [bacterium]|nr:hypothetical protein [bacterium]